MRKTASHSNFLATRTFGSLDGLRCFSILLVLWHHSERGDLLGQMGQRGFLGVDMFFVLSGFLIVTLLLRENDRNGEISLKAFYVRRALRIMPLYYGVVLACAIVFGFFMKSGSMAGPFFADLPFLLTYTTNWVEMGSLLGITWSLSAEEQFYLLWPPIQKFVRHRIWVLLALIGVSQAIHLGLVDGLMLNWFGAGPTEPFMLRESTFTPILLGVLLAHVLHNRSGFDFVARLIGHRWAPLVLVAAIGLGGEFLPADLRGWPRLAFHILFTLLLASCVLREDHALAGFLSWAPIKRIGVISYGMYLFHMFVRYLVYDLLPFENLPQVVGILTLVAGTVVVSELSFRFYEARFLRLKSHFTR